MISANSRRSGGTAALETVQEWQRLQSSSAGGPRKPYFGNLASWVRNYGFGAEPVYPQN